MIKAQPLSPRSRRPVPFGRDCLPALVQPPPLHVGDTLVKSSGDELLEGAPAEVDVSLGAGRASVNNPDRDLGSASSQGHPDAVSTDRVGVRVRGGSTEKGK